MLKSREIPKHLNLIKISAINLRRDRPLFVGWARFFCPPRLSLDGGQKKAVNPTCFARELFHLKFVAKISVSLLVMVLAFLFMSVVQAHGVDANTQQFLQANQGVAIGPFLYIGAKHMLTGYDHLLFLLGVIFFLFRTRDILIYVSLFTLGHSLTLFFGVLADVAVNAYIIDAIIGLSIVYKGFDNLGGFQRLFGRQPDTKMAVLVFGLFHGLGLATKLQDFVMPEQNLWKNLLAFNVGVEIGQFLALLFVLTLLNFWRRYRSYFSFAVVSNTLLMTGGLVLFGYQMAGYVFSV